MPSVSAAIVKVETLATAGLLEKDFSDLRSDEERVIQHCSSSTIGKRFSTVERRFFLGERG